MIKCKELLVIMRIPVVVVQLDVFHGTIDLHKITKTHFAFENHRHGLSERILSLLLAGNSLVCLDQMTAKYRHSVTQNGTGMRSSWHLV